MPYGLYIAAEGAHAQSKRLEVIANNLANVDTVGFKRELAVFQARYAEATQRGHDYPGSGSINDLGGGVLVRETKTEFSPGPLKETGVETDLALRNEGDFFVVGKDDQIYLTRAGNFQINQRGELVAQYGRQQFTVLDEAFDPIAINPAIPDWEFTSTGTIRQAGLIQNLAIVRPESLGDLVKTGENLFRTSAVPTAVAANQRSVAQGFLEASGVQPTTEMIEMIEASRAVEANLNMMRAQDQMLSGLVNRVLRA